MAAGGGLARPEPTGYGHTDSETAYHGDTSIGGLRTHPSEDPYEFTNWGEAWDESHKETGRKKKPADDVERLKPEPDWPMRTEAGMSWKVAFFGDQVKVRDLKREDGGVLSYNGRPVAVQQEGILVIEDHTTPALTEAVQNLIASARLEGLKVERLEYDKLVNFIRQIQPKRPEVESMSGTAKTKRTRAAKGNGISAGHKKIINELLEKEDAKPTGDVVRLAESNPRKEFARYQIPTDRGLKDIEIWGDYVKVRSESTYGFSKKAQDGMDGLPDRVAPDDDPGAPPEMGMPDEGMTDESMPGEAEEMPEGLLLHIDVSVSTPDGMEEEEAISVLDEVLRDPEIADMINERLSESGLSLSILEVESEDEDDDEMDDEYEDMGEEYEGDLADEVVDPGENDAQEGCGY